MRSTQMLGTLIMALATTCALTSAQETQPSAPPTFAIPELWGTSNFYSEDVCKVVNQLRALGKDQALAKLQQFLNEAHPFRQETVAMLVIMLFENPEGWGSLRFGGPRPAVDPEVVKQFPRFPVAIVDKCPFMLVQYSGTGRISPGRQALLAASEQEMIKEDLATEGHAAAAKKLVESPAFKALFTSEPHYVEVNRERIVASAVRKKDAETRPGGEATIELRIERIENK